ncbi:MAG: AarF/ABC1/UbiB kinase family protein [Actinomycetia bacterium]|nr:AarF/ABC1/UbiB kinase family protein [Actinomycetes bacterium]
MRGWGGRGRSLARYEAIAAVLARHGLAYVADVLGIGRRRVRTLAPPDAGWPERLVYVLAALGATFVKLGQLASTRTDLLPPEALAALERLQDAVPPVDFATVRRTLEAAWERPVDAVLAALDPEPLATASVGQVHAARLRDGTEVVVKVRRPGIVEEARADFVIVRDLAELAERRTPWGKAVGVRALAEELIHTMEAELDFRREARNTDRARRHLAARRDVAVPHVYWEWTRPDVLVLSRLEGAKLTDAAALRRLGFRPEEVAARLVGVMYEQIFVDGFFHADPHPGNVHLAPDGTLLLLDWGMVGELGPEMRRRSVDLLLGLMRGRSDWVVDALLRMGAAGPDVDRAGLVAAVEQLRRRYYEAALDEFNLGQALGDLLRVARAHRLAVPGDYAVLAKTAVTLDGLVRRLDPRATLVDYGRAFVGPLLWSRFGPEGLKEVLIDQGRGWARVLERLPYGVDRLIDRIDRGEVRIQLEHRHLDRLLAHWENLIRHLAMTLLLGALLVSSALVAHRTAVDRIVGAPVGEWIFFAASILALLLLAEGLLRRRL